MEPLETECAVIVDTNILLEVPDLHAFNWGVAPITVYVLRSVLDELQGLARDQQNLTKAKTARRVLGNLENILRRMPAEGYPLPGGGRLLFPDPPSQIRPPLDPENVDHQQIASARERLLSTPSCFCAIVTRDREMHDIAISTRPTVPVVMPGGGPIEQAIQQQLRRLIDWWELPGAEATPPGEGRPVEKVQRPPRRRPDPQTRILRMVRRLYGRVRATHHRAVLTVAPREMRLALSAHLIRILTEAKRRVVFLFVANERTAQEWARELRQRCKLPAKSVLVFGDEPIARVSQARVVLYRHDQIERRLDQHVTRFTEAGRRITALVDGCDLVDPVGIAMLLFDCDQFIGFTRHPPGHAQAVGGRMLDVFFQQQTIATYTFADAEQDGWLHPFDVIRQPVAFDTDELAHYSEINDRFVALHGEIRCRYPELRRANDFGPPLHRILARTVDHRAAQLFTLREQREELAQMASAKLEVVAQLVSEAGSPARCLIFDYEQLWTNLICQHLAKQEKTTQVLVPTIDSAGWQDVWRRFERNQLDCLILHDVPPAELVKARINRLILLTPLTPLTLLAAVTDWALSHAASGPTVGIDLLYTVDTPEQEAMMDFADTCCGLHLGRGLGIPHT